MTDTFPRGSGDRRAFRGLNVSVNYGGLVLVARAGFFVPNGKHDRSHRGATLLLLLLAGTGGGGVMTVGGHEMKLSAVTLAIAARVPSTIEFVSVKIA